MEKINLVEVLNEISKYNEVDLFRGTQVEHMVYDDRAIEVYDDTDFEEWLDDKGLEYGSNYEQEHKGYQEFKDSFGNSVMIRYDKVDSRFGIVGEYQDIIYVFNEYYVKND